MIIRKTWKTWFSHFSKKGVWGFENMVLKRGLGLENMVFSCYQENMENMENMVFSSGHFITN